MARVVKVGSTVVVADVTSSEDAEKSALQNAIERLRDPSHVRMLPASELDALLGEPPLTIENVEIWDKAREFEEWMGIVADPERAEPLRTMVRALAKAGEALLDGRACCSRRDEAVAGRLIGAVPALLCQCLDACSTVTCGSPNEPATPSAASRLEDRSTSSSYPPRSRTPLGSPRVRTATSGSPSGPSTDRARSSAASLPRA